jgi:hypothetical protein
MKDIHITFTDYTPEGDSISDFTGEKKKLELKDEAYYLTWTPELVKYVKDSVLSGSFDWAAAAGKGVAGGSQRLAYESLDLADVAVPFGKGEYKYIVHAAGKTIESGYDFSTAKQAKIFAQDAASHAAASAGDSGAYADIIDRSEKTVEVVMLRFDL